MTARRWGPPLLLLGSLVLTAWAYLPSLDVGFVFDDISSIVEAPAVHWPAVSIENVRMTLDGARLPRRPVANLSFGLNHAFDGLDPFGYHLANLFIHLVVGLVLVWVTYEYLRGAAGVGHNRSGQWMVAVLPAALFLVHPLNTQAVTYAVQRMSSLAALFCLVSLGAYLQGRRVDSRAARRAWFAGAVASWLLAVGSKENALILPVVIATWEWCFHRSAWWKAVQRLGQHPKRAALVGVAVLATVAVSTLMLLRFARGVSIPVFDVIPGRDFTGLERMLTQSRVQLLYLSLLLWPAPARLNLEHDVAVSRTLLDPPVTLFAAVLWLVVIVGAVILVRRRPLLGFPVLAYLEFHLIEAGPIGLDLMFEHRMYLPMTMLALLVAAGLAETRSTVRRVAVPIVVLLAVVLAGATHARNRTWVEPLELHRDIAEKSPRSARAQHNLGVALLIAGRPEEAAVPLERAVELEPDKALPWSQLGHAYLETGRFGEAERAFRRAFALDPRDDRSGYNVAVALERQGRAEDAARFLTEIGTRFGMRGRIMEAIRALRRAVELEPTSSTSHNQLGSALLVAGRLADATAAYREAVRLDPENAEALYNLGLVLEREGNARGAAEAYRRFLRHAPPRLEAQIEQVRRKLAAFGSM